MVGFALQLCAQVPCECAKEPEGRKQYLRRCSLRGCTGSSAGRNGSAPAPAPASLPSAGTLSRTSCQEKGILRDALLGSGLAKEGDGKGSFILPPHPCVPAEGMQGDLWSCAEKCAASWDLTHLWREGTSMGCPSQGKKLLPLALILHGMGFLGKLLSTLGKQAVGPPVEAHFWWQHLVPNVTPKIE